MTRKVGHLPVNQSLDRNTIYTFGKKYTRWGAVLPGKFVPVLKIEGKCSRLRARAAHFPGHLPSGGQHIEMVVNSVNVRRFLRRNIGIDQQDAGETASHLASSIDFL